ncbi:hypothetical protein C5Y93_00025 [Blastopirellula marina]|uniref:Uncharacterized protein n=1 Tax=Blastopirellula marina TaxID=124 RepID=A0A2S8GVN7_9BACT|nr:hypothetical protein C5Y93_00025 [Blastopirellula marina]
MPEWDAGEDDLGVGSHVTNTGDAHLAKHADPDPHGGDQHGIPASPQGNAEQHGEGRNVEPGVFFQGGWSPAEGDAG